jgi:hypothetical protein
VDSAEATARAVRLERLAGDLELVQRECPEFGDSVGEMLQRVRQRFTPEVWSGPAAERAFAGLQAASAQAMWARQEIDQVEQVTSCAVSATREKAEVLRRAVIAANQSGAPVVDDAVAQWPAGKAVPPRDPVPPPRAEVPPPPGAHTGFVGLNLAEAAFLRSDLAQLLDWAEGLAMAWADSVLARLSSGLYELARDVPGTPTALSDLSWARVSDRLELVGRWGHDTAADLTRRMEVFGAASAGPGTVTATFVFPDRAAASAAAKGDAAAIRSILGQDVPVLGVVHPVPTSDQMRQLKALLERTEERFYDTGYAAEVLNNLGPDQIRELIVVATKAGPDTVARLYALIGSATRSGKLDQKVEATLLADGRLAELANSDARLSNAFAVRAADALLDPSRRGEQGIGTPGPDAANLAAAQHLMERYDIAHVVDPARLAALAGNIYLPADMVADMFRLAVLAETDQARSAQTLDGLLANLGGDCNKESKRLLAEAVVTHMDHLADVIGAGDPGATNTRRGIKAILGDPEARETVVDGASNYAEDGFSQVAASLASVLTAHGEYTAEQAFAAIPDTSEVLAKIGRILHAVAAWDGGAKSDLPALLTAGFGLAVTAVGTIASGGAWTIALAGVGAAADVVGKGAQAGAEHRVADRGVAHAQNVRDVAYYMAASSLLLNPGPPPLCNLLVATPPRRKDYPTLFDAEGRFLIPQPGTDEWMDFYTWVTKTKGNERLRDAVNHLMEEIDFGPAFPN